MCCGRGEVKILGLWSTVVSAPRNTLEYSTRTDSSDLAASNPDRLIDQ